MDINNLLSEDSLDAISSSTPKLSKSNESLVNIPRSPVNCPVTSCSGIIGVTSILSHFLRDHGQKFNVEFEQVTSQQRSILIMDEDVFPIFNENVCLGILIYAGKTLDEEASPAVVGLCRPNSFLPQKYSHLVNYLPILIMGCKTSLTSVFEDKQLAEEYYDPYDSDQQIVVIWLTTIETTKPLECTITAFNSETPTSRSILSEVRNLKYSQEPPMFMPRESNYLMLTRGELNLLSKNARNDIHLEIVIQEYDE